jgi:peptidoglycan-associated lipoprotein
MKFSSMMVVFSVALAFALTGCRYNKSGAAGAGGMSGAGGDEGVGSLAIGSDLEGIEMAESGSLDQISGGARFEELYTRCSDIDFKPVYFGLDSSVVPGAELGKIDAVAGHLLENADRVVVVEGNCDDRGSDEYNMSLRENRATIVRNYLVENGVSADRIQTRSYGEERPAVVGQGESVWSKNRRAEFVVFKK